ncbi:KRE1 [Candida pseudojiufengensis]|uniref:KRE1 n=1 Tax=Candida pseudojiufengensis TaxID=497109 RepID=UPI002225782E|nr:KRE1 [Candida pseudojiufengensis]KAI5961378.1 KRE1 [Candida pseudojiufengensis]
MLSKLQKIIILAFIFLISFSKAETTETDTDTTTSKSSVSPTLVWVTGTDSLGITRTTQSPYSQSFMTTYTENQLSISSGSIGLGSLVTAANDESISHKIGEIRSYDMTTISQGSGSNLKILSFNLNNPNLGISFFTKFFGLGFIFIISVVLLI